jgi:hypothetical protein
LYSNTKTDHLKLHRFFGDLPFEVITFCIRIQKPMTSKCISPKNFCNLKSSLFVFEYKNDHLKLKFPKEYLQFEVIGFCIMRNSVLNATILTGLKYMSSLRWRQVEDQGTGIEPPFEGRILLKDVLVQKRKVSKGSISVKGFDICFQTFNNSTLKYSLSFP